MPQLFPLFPGPIAPSLSLAPSLTLAPDAGGSLVPLVAVSFVQGVMPKVGLHPAVGLHPIAQTTTGLVPAAASSGTLSPS